MKRCLSCEATFHGGWVCPRCNYSPSFIDGYLSFAPELAAGHRNPTDFEKLASIEAGNFWFRARNRLITWAIRRYFRHAQSLLEVGCGTGFVLLGIQSAFPGIALSGSEASCAGLTFASRRVPDASLFQMDARKIPFSDEFDVIGAFDVLEHVHEDEQVLAEIYRAVKRGGGIVVTVPQHAFLWSNVDDVAGHVRRYSARDLESKMTRTGFHVVRKSSFVSLLLPLMIASRRHRDDNGKRTANTEFGLSPFANGVLEKILGLERGLIQLGISLPVGGSLLIVGTKI